MVTIDILLTHNHFDLTVQRCMTMTPIDLTLFHDFGEPLIVETQQCQTVTFETIKTTVIIGSTYSKIEN